MPTAAPVSGAQCRSALPKCDSILPVIDRMRARRPPLRFDDDATERAFLEECAAGDRRRHVILWTTIAVITVLMRFADRAVSTDRAIEIIRPLRHWVTAPIALAVAAWALVPDRLWRKTWQAVTATGYAVFFSTVCLIQLALMRRGIEVPAGWFYFACTILVSSGLVAPVLSLRVVHTVPATLVPALLEIGLLVVHPSGLPGLTEYMTFWLLSAVAFGAVAGFQLEKLRRRDFLQRRQIEEGARAQRGAPTPR